MPKEVLEFIDDDFYNPEIVKMYPDALDPITYYCMQHMCGEDYVKDDVHTHMRIIRK